MRQANSFLKHMFVKKHMNIFSYICMAFGHAVQKTCVRPCHVPETTTALPLGDYPSSTLKVNVITISPRTIKGTVLNIIFRLPGAPYPRMHLDRYGGPH